MLTLFKEFSYSTILISLLLIIFLLNVSVSAADVPDKINKITLRQINPITINGNYNFSSTALIQGWTGNGTEISPYIIDGINISTTSTYPLRSDALDISNTSVYFKIVNSFFSTEYLSYPLLLTNVSNGQIINSSTFGSFVGPKLINSTNINFFNFTTNYQYGAGIQITNSSHVSIQNSSIFNIAQGRGIVVENSQFVEINGNYIFQATDDGISLINSKNVNVSLNVIRNMGFSITPPPYNSPQYGSGYGINIDQNSENSYIFNNSLINNTINGYCNNNNNSFHHNYWSDQSNSQPYSLSGTGSCVDQTPSPMPISNSLFKGTTIVNSQSPISSSMSQSSISSSTSQSSFLTSDSNINIDLIIILALGLIVVTIISIFVYNKNKQYKKGGFLTKGEFREAMKFKVNSKSELELIKKYNVQDYSTANLLKKGNFESLSNYEIALNFGVKDNEIYEILHIDQFLSIEDWFSKWKNDIDDENHRKEGIRMETKLLEKELETCKTPNENNISFYKNVEFIKKIEQDYSVITEDGKLLEKIVAYMNNNDKIEFENYKKIEEIYQTIRKIKKEGESLIEELSKKINVKKELFSHWNELSNLLKNFQANIQISLKRIAELIKISEKDTEELIQLILQDNKILGEYLKLEQVFIRSSTTAVEIDNLLRSFEEKKGKKI